MIEKAMINDIVNKNPARGIKIGPHDKKEPRVLTPEEQSIFSECSKGTFYDNLFVVAVSTGLRPGEAYGYKMNIRTYVLIACYVCQVTPYELQESTRNTQCLWTFQRFGSCRKKAISDGENVLVVLDMVLENT